MTAQPALWTLSGTLIALAAVSALAEHRRAKRRDLDRPGWVPWTALQILAAIAAVAAAAVALHV